MDSSYFITFVNSFFFWCVLLGVSNGIEFRRRKEFLGTSSTSSLACAILNCLIIIGIGPILLLDFQIGQPTSEAINQFMIFQIAFFIAHSMVILVSAKPRIDELFHHGIAMAALIGTVWSGQMGGEVLFVLVLSELSFCFFLTHFFKSIDQQVAAYWSSLAFRWVFTIVRLFIIPICSFYIFNDPNATVAIQVVAVLFNVLNLYWTVGIWKKPMPPKPQIINTQANRFAVISVN